MESDRSMKTVTVSLGLCRVSHERGASGAKHVESFSRLQDECEQTPSFSVKRRRFYVPVSCVRMTIGLTPSQDDNADHSDY
ncbi:hypothetical protein [Laceyella tengchongensis]|uniref:hypothetical protein n=1 Tax=Laceyella tengchongensis TaxID=574699 RepID=UPI0012B8DA87|nr:hypothetical protein [Laceyella tengchongensis]